MIKKFLFLLLFSTQVFANDTGYFDQVSAGIESTLDPLKQCRKFVKAKNFKEGIKKTLQDGTEALLVCGVASVGARPSHKDFMHSRSIALEKAIMDSKIRYSSYLGEKIISEVSNVLQEQSETPPENGIANANYDENNAQDITKSLATNLAISGALSAISGDLWDLNNLMNLGFHAAPVALSMLQKSDTPQQKSKIIEKITTSETFKSTVKSIIAPRQFEGFYVLEVFDSCKKGQKKCEIAVALARSTHSKILSRIISGTADASMQSNTIQATEPPKSFSTKYILANVGVRMQKLKNNRYRLYSIYIVSPKTSSQTSVRIAERKAALQAKSAIGTFVKNTFAASESNDTIQETITQETIKEIKGETTEDENFNNKIEDIFNQKLEQFSEAFIRGIIIEDTGTVQHPASPHKGVYAIAYWDLNSANTASKQLQDMQNIPKSQNSTNKQSQDMQNQSIPMNQNNTITIQKDTYIESEEADF